MERPPGIEHTTSVSANHRDAQMQTVNRRKKGLKRREGLFLKEKVLRVQDEMPWQLLQHPCALSQWK